VPLKITGEVLLTHVPEKYEQHLFLGGENILGTMATCTDWAFFEHLLDYPIPKTGTSAAGLEAKIERTTQSKGAVSMPVFIVDYKPGLHVQSMPKLFPPHNLYVTTIMHSFIHMLIYTI
jgi:hypothetical protein